MIANKIIITQNSLKSVWKKKKVFFEKLEYFGMTSLNRFCLMLKFQNDQISAIYCIGR